MEEAQYPIRTVATITGINPVTLRAWERRYGLIRPTRTTKGHRLYSDEDVRKILHILEMLDEGVTISQVSARLQEQTESRAIDSPWAVPLEQMFQAVTAFDSRELERVYNEALSLYPLDIVSRQLLSPLLVRLGERWQKTPGGIAEEHFFGSYMRNKLGAWFHHHDTQGQGHRAVAACLPGEMHEIGLLMACQSLITHGLQIVYLGAGLPIAEVQITAERTQADIVLLSGAAIVDPSPLVPDLQLLAEHHHGPICLGGKTSVQYRDQLERAGVVPVGDDLKQATRTVMKLVENL